MNTKGKITDEQFEHAMKMKAFHEQEAEKWTKITRAYQYALQHQIRKKSEQANREALNRINE